MLQHCSASFANNSRRDGLHAEHRFKPDLISSLFPALEPQASVLPFDRGVANASFSSRFSMVLQ